MCTKWRYLQKSAETGLQEEAHMHINISVESSLWQQFFPMRLRLTRTLSGYAILLLRVFRADHR